MQNRRAAQGGTAVAQAYDRLASVENEAETGGSKRAGLAGHRLGEPLALQLGGQVGFMASAQDAAKQFHHVSPSACRVGSLPPVIVPSRLI